MKQLLSAIIILILLSTKTAFTQPKPENGWTCPFQNRIYKPHPSFYDRDIITLDYRITSQAAPYGHSIVGWRERDYFIHVFKHQTKLELSRYRMSLHTTLGAGGSYIGGQRFIELDRALNRNYEQPYYFIIPNLAPSLFETDWEKLSQYKADPETEPTTQSEIIFFTATRTPPDFTLPDVWVFDSCIKDATQNLKL